MLALCDTGASASIIHPILLKAFPPSLVKPAPDYPRYKAAHGEFLEIQGQAELIIRVNGLLMSHTFLDSE